MKKITTKILLLQPRRPAGKQPQTLANNIIWNGIVRAARGRATYRVRAPSRDSSLASGFSPRAPPPTSLESAGVEGRRVRRPWRRRHRRRRRRRRTTVIPRTTRRAQHIRRRHGYVPPTDGRDRNGPRNFRRRARRHEIGEYQRTRTYTHDIKYDFCSDKR